MRAFNYSPRYANAVRVLNRLLDKEFLSAEEIRLYDDQGRVIEYINNRLLVPVLSMKISRDGEYVRVWYLSQEAIDDYYNRREYQFSQQRHAVAVAHQHRKASTAARLLLSLGETVPESIRMILAANDD